MQLSKTFTDNSIDTVGDTYEYLMQMYASKAGKSGGEYFTPQEVSEVLARIACCNNPNIQKVYDPACGSGSLLMKFVKYVGEKASEIEFYDHHCRYTGTPDSYRNTLIKAFFSNHRYLFRSLPSGNLLLTVWLRHTRFSLHTSLIPGKHRSISHQMRRYIPCMEEAINSLLLGIRGLPFQETVNVFFYIPLI
jgi:hypothetical protein